MKESLEEKRDAPLGGVWESTKEASPHIVKALTAVRERILLDTGWKPSQKPDEPKNKPIP